VGNRAVDIRDHEDWLETDDATHPEIMSSTGDFTERRLIGGACAASDGRYQARSSPQPISERVKRAEASAARLAVGRTKPRGQPR
jgi:hypothetical protein